MIRKPKLNPNKELAVQAINHKAVQATNAQQQHFLACFAAVGTLPKAARLSGLSRAAHHRWMQESSKYRRAYRVVRRGAGAHLESALMDRAIYGWLEPVFKDDMVVGYKRKFDNTLGWKMLQHNHPRYAPKDSPLVSVQTKVEVDVDVEVEDNTVVYVNDWFDQPTPEQIEQLRSDDGIVDAETVEQSPPEPEIVEHPLI